MKHIKSHFIFESKTESDLYLLIKDHLQDIIDDDICDIVVENGESGDNMPVIHVTVQMDKDNDTNDINEFLDDRLKSLDVIKQLKHLISFILKEYPNKVNIGFSLDETDEYTSISIDFKECDVVKGEFWMKSNYDSISLNFKKLREILKLPKSTKINFSSNGETKFLNFYFKNSNELDDHKDDLISNFTKLEIDDKLICDYMKKNSRDEIVKYIIHKDYNRHRSSGYYDTRKDIVNYIEFGLSKEFEWEW